MGTTYTVQHEQDETGIWCGVFDRSQGVSCIGQGNSIDDARRQVRNALAVYLRSEAAARAAVLVDRVGSSG